MAEICSCETIMGNTGVPTCYSALKLGKGIFMTPTFANDGTKNVIDTTDTLNDAYFTALINNADPSKRLYPLQKLNAVASERADPTYDTRSDGGNAFVKDGIRSYSFEIWEGGARLKKELDKGRCREFSFYIFNEGQLIGMDLTDEQLELAPIRIAKDSLVVSYMFPDDSKVEKINVKFQFNQSENDGNLSFVEVESDVDLTGYRGLLDIYSTVSNIAATGFKVKLKNKYGPANVVSADSGLIITDFSLYNLTNSAAVTISAVTEVSDGEYDFTIPSTVGKTLRLTPTKTGRDYKAVVSNTFITP